MSSTLYADADIGHAEEEGRGAFADIRLEHTAAPVGETRVGIRNTGLVALYFSAHWCPPCRAFTPVLAQLAESLVEDPANPAIQFVFVSSDHDEEAFQEYWTTMGFAAVQFGGEGEEDRRKLQVHYKVRGLPTLLVVDAATGRLIDRDARSTVQGGFDPSVPATGLDILTRWAKSTTSDH